MPRSLSPVVLPGDPSSALESSTKQYIDAALALKIDAAQIGVANGVAGLDASGDVPTANLPDLSATYIPVSQKDVTNGIPVLTGSVLPRKYQQYANSTQDGTVVLTNAFKGTATAPDLVMNSWRAPAAGNVTLTNTDGAVVVTPSGAQATATLFTPVGNANKRVIIKKAAGTTAYPVAITTPAGNIDGVTTIYISIPGDYRELISDGTNWQVIGGTGYPVITSPSAPANGATATIDATTGTVFRFAPAVAGWTLGVPSNGVDGMQINIEITPSVAFSLTINASVINCTGVASPMSVPSGKKLFIGLRYSGTTWYLIAYALQP